MNKRRPCTIDGCDKPRVGRGWCSKHWTRWSRYGSPTARMPGEVVDGKKVCKDCSVDQAVANFHKGGRSPYCKPCEAERQRAYLVKNPRPAPARNARDCICEICGSAFVGSKKQYLRCSPECKKLGQNRANMKFVQARRAAERHPEAEKIAPREIFIRDNWMCGLCGDLIDAQFKAPHPGTPSIDHIVPLARGGSHVRANVQAAHLGCNVRKGARLAS